MKQIIIYGGAFNPPTLAHLAIAKECKRYAEQIGAELWIMPSGPRPDKTISTNPELRQKLIKAFVQDLGKNIRIEFFEMNKSGLTETRITRAYLKTMYPDTHFIWVYGADSLGTMREWKNGVEIWNQDHMYIFNRPGYTIDEVPPFGIVCGVDGPAISSTLVRARITSGETYAELVPVHVCAVLDSEVQVEMS